MAIAKINKIEIIALKEHRERLLDILQGLGFVQLIKIDEAVEKAVDFAGGEADILEIEEAIPYLSTFKEKSRFLDSIVALKPPVYRDELARIIADFDYRAFLKELAASRANLRNAVERKERLSEEKKLLLPWRKLNVRLDQLYHTEHCGILLGTFAARDYDLISEDLKKEGIELFFEVIHRDRVNIHAVFIYMKENLERVEAVLKNYRFNFAALGHDGITVKDKIFEINLEAMIHDDEIEEIKSHIAGMLRHQFKLMAIYDCLVNIKRKREAETNFAEERHIFVLKGWIKEKDIAALQKALQAKLGGLAVFISDPKPGEDIPVDLENNRFIQPFEFITKIYGFPKYSELDPTPFLAPFFFLYFGFCVSDAGYGFILALTSFFLLKKFRMGPQGARAFRLFFYCGISTIIIGALTGSWFGNAVDMLAGANAMFTPLKEFKDSLTVLDPVKEPTKLLAIALSFGIIQVWFGNIVAAIGNIKNKRYLAVFLDQVPMLVFLFGLTGAGLVFLRIAGGNNMNLFKYASSAGALGLALTQGRSEKGIGAKLFYGIYNLYAALSGYLSDILSYSRLWALGLVTGVMATTINLISVQFSQIFVSVIPFVDKIAAIKVFLSSIVLILIFVGGHLVSFLMNLLGAFVHPVRLQFVEFFTKFFKETGRAFKPFKVETKYVEIK